ncbi:stage II sporulation protein P [Domibacillus enclensis]|uniref:Stage II sporulation protein P n=2 Tax=Domibacillus enclensis TaxID=1017273 RepID=A0A1N6VYN0_9BACI|nr:stage II sporulation protein P [Domibacillus enclensis]SIQ82987.1 stage II sporulation protein P [Domibacillus enclensis]
MESTNEKNNKKTTRIRSRLRTLLEISILLFTLWLLFVLFLLFLSNGNETGEQPLLNDLRVLTGIEMESLENVPLFNDVKKAPSEASVDKKDAEESLENPERDEIEFSMEELLMERELLFQNAEAIFENIKIPESTDHSHSPIERDRVYIYHSHSRESFLPYFKNTNQPEDAFHPKLNITLAGKMLERALERRGVGAQSDSTDIVSALEEKGMEYGSSYLISRERVRSAKKANKNFDILLDIHRDSLRKSATTIEKNGETYARLLFVVGTGHAAYEENLSFANDLHEKISAQNPGLSKGILTKDSHQGNGVYNQDLAPRSVILEVGGVDNTAEEISRTIEVLADVLSGYD